MNARRIRFLLLLPAHFLSTSVQSESLNFEPLGIIAAHPGVPKTARQVEIENGYGYLLTENGLYTMGVRVSETEFSLGTPILQSQLPRNDVSSLFALSGPRLYVSAKGEVVIFDRSDPLQLSELGRFYGIMSAVSNDFVFGRDGEGPLVWDTRNPSSIPPGVTLPISGRSFPVGDYLMVDSTDFDTATIDIRSPTQPLLKHAHTFDLFNAIFFTPTILFGMGDYDSGGFLDVSNPESPVQFGRQDLPGERGILSADGTFLCKSAIIRNREAIIQGFDASDPTHQKWLGYFRTRYASPGAFDVVDKYVFVLHADSGVLDVWQYTGPPVGEFDMLKADVNHDGIVDARDLLILEREWNPGE